ncbi:hypothetical protein GCM10009304_18030 [Pseudomonas matsuisoli]|uniref:DUF3301 domain-containing protein n=2 Tax=Pseudomonas matsuisoli TaxID=1515666 RepID=A0A917PUS4_9PSED|nr:hypothetical protein GCM10009304_18030 [Pseudomonas matsuisoli]
MEHLIFAAIFVVLMGLQYWKWQRDTASGWPKAFSSTLEEHGLTCAEVLAERIDRSPDCMQRVFRANSGKYYLFVWTRMGNFWTYPDVVFREIPESRALAAKI